MLTVALVDDHTIFRDGLKLLFSLSQDVEVVGEAATANAAYDMVDATDPDVVVLDMVMPDVSGILVTRELLRREPSRRVLMLSMVKDPVRVAQALDAGATGYATKDLGADEVVSAVHAVADGHRYLPATVDRSEVEKYQLLNRDGGTIGQLEVLTPREREVFDLTVGGCTTEAISERLFISKRTVETHRARILHKLNVKSSFDLVRLAARLGLMPL